MLRHCKQVFEASGGKGKIIEVRPSKVGGLNVYENGVKELSQFYHQVSTDGRYVYDPRLSSSPVPKGDWERHIKISTRVEYRSLISLRG